MEGKNATSQRPSSAIRGPASSASSGKQKAGYALPLQFSISLSAAVQLHLSRQCCCICCLAGSWYTDLGTHCTCTYTSAKTRRKKLVTAGDAVQCGTVRYSAHRPGRVRHPTVRHRNTWQLADAHRLYSRVATLQSSLDNQATAHVCTATFLAHHPAWQTSKHRTVDHHVVWLRTHAWSMC